MTPSPLTKGVAPATVSRSGAVGASASGTGTQVTAPSAATAIASRVPPSSAAPEPHVPGIGV